MENSTSELYGLKEFLKSSSNLLKKISKGLFQEKSPSAEKAFRFRHFVTFFNNDKQGPRLLGEEQVICFVFMVLTVQILVSFPLLFKVFVALSSEAFCWVALAYSLCYSKISDY